MACVSRIASEKQIPRFARNDIALFHVLKLERQAARGSVRNDTLAACNGDFSRGVTWAIIDEAKRGSLPAGSAAPGAGQRVLEFLHLTPHRSA
jgi:hypothetical protein